MWIITDKEAERSGLTNATPDERAAALQDAQTVYSWIREQEQTNQEWATDDTLRSWGEAQGWSTDRMNNAINLARSSGRVVTAGG